MITINNCTEVTAKINFKIPNKEHIPAKLSVKVASLAERNILPLRTFKQIHSEQPVRVIKKLTTILNTYNRTTIRHIGMFWFFIADAQGSAILGLPGSCNLRSIITLIDNNLTIPSLTKTYPGHVDYTGHFPGKYHIVIDPTIVPVIHALQKCLIYFKDEIKAELDRMTRCCIIRKINKLTDWLGSKKIYHQLQLCLNLGDLNKTIKWCYCRTPTLEKITHQLAVN